MIEYVYIDKSVFDEIVQSIKKYKETGDERWMSLLANLKIIQRGSLSIELPETD